MTAPAAIGSNHASVIEKIARRWIGTPYRHRASIEGVGADCLGLIRGIWREVVGSETYTVPVYSPDWISLGDADVMVAEFSRHLTPVNPTHVTIGDIAVFRFSRSSPAKHAGIVVSGINADLHFIHSYSRFGVVENAFDQRWRARVVACFRFPVRSN